MTGRIEGPRRHGHFDRRWSTSRRVTADWRATVGVGTSAVPGGLEWDAFSTRYFPRRSRHDLEAISAYDSYRHGPTAAREQPPGGRRSIGPNEPDLTVVRRARSAAEHL